MNRRSAKNKGAQEEIWAVKYAKENGFPDAERRKENGVHDRGDVAGIPGWTIQVKADNSYAIPKWMRDVDKQAERAGTINRMLLMKPIGVGFERIAEHWALMPYWNWVGLARQDVNN